MAWSDTASILNDARVTRQELGTALTGGLTELRGSLDQIRLEVLEAVNAGVSSLRDENRELRNRLNKTASELAEARQDLARTRVDIEGLHRHLAETRAHAVIPEGEPTILDVPAQRQPAEQLTQPSALETLASQPSELESVATEADSPALEPREEQPALMSASEERAEQAALNHRKHAGLLLSAAGISSATLVCHRDTFAFLVEQAASERHFHIPGEVEDAGQGRVQAALSGRSLIAALTSLWNAYQGAGEASVDWALAFTLYLRIATAIDTSLKREGGSTVTIILDDRTPVTEAGPSPADEAA